MPSKSFLWKIIHLGRKEFISSKEDKVSECMFGSGNFNT